MLMVPLLPTSWVAWAQACSKISQSIASAQPVSSAISRKSCGSSSPRSGWFQRSSAS